MNSRVGYVIVGGAVVIAAFVATLAVLNEWPDPSSPPPSATTAPPPSPPASATPPPSPSGPVATRETALAQVPVPAAADYSWIGIVGLNVEPVADTPVVKGQTLLRLTAVPTEGGHALAAQFSSVENGKAYRISAWIKAGTANQIELEVADLAAGKQVSHGYEIFDLGSHKPLDPTSAVDPGMQDEQNGWQMVWVDMPSLRGRCLVKFYLLAAGKTEYKGDGMLSLVLGGFTAEPHS
jgi:hypothetical protein